MKKMTANKWLLMLMCMVLCASCETLSTYEEGNTTTTNGNGKNTSLRIITRGVADEEVVYPLHIYAFDEGGKLSAQQTVTSQEDEINLTLKQMVTYNVVAISADEEVYNLPANPTATSVITMKKPELDETVPTYAQTMVKGYSRRSPLQMASAVITPSTSQTTLALQMMYQVCSLSVKLLNLPAECNASYITVSTPNSGIKLDGVGQEGTQRSLIPLTYADGIWQSGVVYLFPTSGNTTFTMTYNDSESEQIASAVYQSSLKAGVPYKIEGSYEDGSIHIKGDVTPSEWSAPVLLSFNFSNNDNVYVTENGGSVTPGDDTPITEDDIIVDHIPAALTVWNGHMVVDATDVGNGRASLLLMAVVDYNNQTSALNEKSPSVAPTIARNYSEYDLNSGWRIPTTEEARTIYNRYSNNPDMFANMMAEAEADNIVVKDEKGNNIRYLCDEGNSTFSFYSSQVVKAGATISTYHLRPVCTLYVKLDK